MVIRRSTERRLHDRVELEAAIDVRVDQWPVLHAQTRDVSLGGIGIVVMGHTDLTAGDQIDFAIPGSTVTAEVRHVRYKRGGCHVGLVWRRLDGRRVAAIKNLVRYARRRHRIEIPLPLAA